MYDKGRRLWEGTMSNQPVSAGGSAKEDSHVRGVSELGLYEDLMNGSGIWVLGDLFLLCSTRF